MRTPTRRALPALLLAALLAGCAETPPPRREAPESVELSEVPEGVLAAAREALPGVEFEQAWRDEEGGGLAYEIRGTDDRGKTREVKVSASGEVLETE
jgi:hypothetical protein